MSENFKNIIEIISNYVPEELISEEYFSNIYKISNNFSPLISKNIIFESRLGLKEAVTDFAIKIKKDDINLYNNIKKWNNINLLFEYWKNNESFINKYLNDLWLEFDIYDGLNDNFSPNIIFTEFEDKVLKKNLFYSDNSFFINEFLTIFDRQQLSKNQLCLLETCFNFLDIKNKLFTIGIPVTRRSNSIRLCLIIPDEENLISYMKKIGLEKRYNELKSTIHELAKFTDFFILHVDIDDNFGDKICLEISYSDFTNTGIIKDKWQPFFDYLIDKKICTPEKRIALNNWFGNSREIFSDSLCNFITKRFIYEIKIVFERNKNPIAKAYYGISHNPII